MLDNLCKLEGYTSKSISPENPTGEKGGAGRAVEGTGSYFSRNIGCGYKISPSINIAAGKEAVLGNIETSGEIKHIWITCPVDAWRNLIFKCYWDGESTPSIEVPIGDFFCNGWCEPSIVNSMTIVAAPKGGFNSYWPMPFAKGARIVLQNLHYKDCIIYYQIDYHEKNIPENTAKLHAQFRRSNPTRLGEPHIILDGTKGAGKYVGTYIAWQSNSCDWWGEGEVKFYLDGDIEFPSISSTGTEDYFGGAYNFEWPQGVYHEYSTPFLGLSQVIKPDGLYNSQQRFGMYRWHIIDAIEYRKNIKITIDALGVRYDNQYLHLQDDIASTAFWYQLDPHGIYPTMLDDIDRYVSRKINW